MSICKKRTCFGFRGGQLNTFYHNQFSVKLRDGTDYDNSIGKYGNWSMMVFVNETQKNYTQGEFAANIFLQGVMYSTNATMMGFIKTCENRADKDVTECEYFAEFGIDQFIWPDDPTLPQIITFNGSSR